MEGIDETMAESTIHTPVIGTSTGYACTSILKTLPSSFISALRFIGFAPVISGMPFFLFFIALTSFCLLEICLAVGFACFHQLVMRAA